MGKKHQEPLPPIVLMVGLPIHTGEVRRELGFDTPHAKEFFGVSVEYVRVVVEPQDSVWWVDPTKDKSMLELLKSRPSFSPNKYKQWIESPQFVNYVRRDINYMIHYSLEREGRESFDPRWHEAVKMVVLSGWISSGSEYVRRVFDGYFKAAEGHYWWWDSTARELRPIWRDAEVAELKPRNERSELLNMCCDQLGFQPPQIGSKLVNAGVQTVGDLVVLPLVQLSGILGNDSVHYAVVATWARGHGLHIGMTEEEVVSWEEDELKEPRSFPMRYDHGFSDETLLGAG